MTGEDVAARVHAYAWTDRKPGLERTRALLAALGNPEKALKFVHITGSNGKGSTAAMLASVLTAAGYRTGLFTSPHLYRFNERFQVNGAPIPDAALDRLAERVLAAADTLPEHPTEFELMTAIGFLWFAEAGCDLVVVEVGLGGRLDSTNVIPTPEAAVITNIGLEHTAILGSTLAAIAAEKSGILKPGCRAVLYGQSREVGEVVARVCAEKEIPLTVTDASQLTLLSSGLDGQHFTYRGSAPLLLPLLGDYQLRNAMTVLDTVDALRAQGWNISADAVARGLAAARWPGRLELVRRRPDLIIDGGHNPQCAQALAASLRGLYGEKSSSFSSVCSPIRIGRAWSARFCRWPRPSSPSAPKAIALRTKTSWPRGSAHRASPPRRTPPSARRWTPRSLSRVPRTPSARGARSTASASCAIVSACAEIRPRDIRHPRRAAVPGAHLHGWRLL